MIKNLLYLGIMLFIFWGCSGRRSGKIDTQTANDSVGKQKVSDPNKMAASQPEDDDPEPGYDEVKADLLSTYNKVENIDKTIIDGSDTLLLHCKYYCLHDSSLVIPAKYDWSGGGKKEFITHNFASQIILVKNKDTLLNKTFKKVDFNNVLYTQLQKYAIMFSPAYGGFNKERGEFAIDYSVTIPLTDVGVSACISVDKNGKYRVLDEYVKMDGYKK